MTKPEPADMEVQAALCGVTVEEFMRRVEALRSQNGSCTQQGCPVPAMVVCYWPSARDEPFPRYCPDHAAWMQKVAETMGFNLKTEQLPGLPPDRPARRVRVG